MNRKILREKILQHRLQYSQSELSVLGEQIGERVKQTESFRNAPVVHCFFGVEQKGEIGTKTILNEILRSGKKLVMPQVDSRSDYLKHYQVKDLDELSTSRWGIPEPVTGTQVAVKHIDLVLVPGITGDRYGNRIGYGKGYYDRFLGEPGFRGQSILLLPDNCLVDQVPVKPHDIAVDMIATETGVIICRS